MTTNTTTNATGTAADDTPRGFPGLMCPHCGNEGSTLVHLEDVTFHRQECDTDTPLEDMQAVVAKWTRVPAWVALAPAAG
jgi:hypothetical protein